LPAHCLSGELPLGGSGPFRACRSRGAVDLDDYWTVRAVSDSGYMVALTKETGEESSFLLRLCDFKGNVVGDYDTPPTFVRFASDGAAVVRGGFRAFRMISLVQVL